MFYGCYGITNIPENLFRNVILKESSLSEMFRACVNITNIPVNLFDALILPKNCCCGMFRECTGITEIHNILNNLISKILYNFSLTFEHQVVCLVPMQQKPKS